MSKATPVSFEIKRVCGSTLIPIRYQCIGQALKLVYLVTFSDKSKQVFESEEEVQALFCNAQDQSQTQS